MKMLDVLGNVSTFSLLLPQLLCNCAHNGDFRKHWAVSMRGKGASVPPALGTLGPLGGHFSLDPWAAAVSGSALESPYSHLCSSVRIMGGNR
jgi:hypothetical protein